MVAAQNIFLIGPMGAGKTTVGRRLAEVRGLRFVDADHEVEARTGVDIAYIFEREGESGFRRRERQIIDELSAMTGLVLATGGGVVLDEANREHLKARGRVIYLHATVQQQLQRTARSEARPLLSQSADRLATLQALFNYRDPLYRETADLIIATDHRSAKSVVREIERYLDTGAND